MGKCSLNGYGYRFITRYSNTGDCWEEGMDDSYLDGIESNA